MSARKKTVALSAIAVLALGLGACGSAVNTGTGTSQSSAESGGAPAVPASCSGDTPLVSVLLPNQTNPYYVSMKQGFEDAAAANGFKAEVQIAGDDDAQQLAQAQAALQKKPCALALNPVKSEPAAAIVRAANDAGVPVFTVNIIVDPDALKAQGASVVQYLGADNKAGGADIATKILQDMGADATLNIGFVTEPDEIPVLNRDEGFEETIASDANATVEAKVDGNVKATDSLNVTTDMLQGNPDMNVIFASTGPAAQGALEAVKASGRDVKVYGFCAPEVTLTELYPACVAQEPADYGKRVIDQILAYTQGKTVEPQILRPLKMFVSGQTPGAGEVG